MNQDKKYHQGCLSSMRLRIWSIAAVLFLTFFGFLLIKGPFLEGVSAQVAGLSAAKDPDKLGRAKIIEVQVTQFTWQLIARYSKKVVCEVTVEHDGTPNFNEMLNYCSLDTIKTEINSAPNLGTSLTPQPTPPGIDEAVIARFFIWKYKESFQVTRQVSVPLPDMFVNVSAPAGPVAQPFVYVSAYEPAVDYKIIGIRGTINSIITFTCSSDQCKLPILQDSSMEFWAISSFGDESKHVFATIRINGQPGAYIMDVKTQRPLTTFTDACAEDWGLPQSATSPWASFPDVPQQLNTAQTLYYLTGKLISVGIVDASGCPGAGFLADGSPNGCGMDTAHPMMVQWQNQFDPVIWVSSRESGIPARLLKTLIQVESQYWPGTGDNTLAEYGLTQLNYLGLDTALRWDPQLFKQLCNNTIYDCNKGYASMPPDLQAQAKGALLNLIDSACVNCPGGINLTSASQSIPMLSQALRANCAQTKYILDDQTLKSDSYDDMWRFTLVSYHSGYQCLYDALALTKKFLEPVDWLHVSSHLNCKNAASYVNDFWNSLAGFTPVIAPQEASQSMSVPVMTTPTPIPSPTPYISKAQLHILIYMDNNNDHQPQPDEMVDGMAVTVTFSDGPSLTQTVTGGQAFIDLSNHLVGTRITVSIKNLFLFYEYSIPATGEIPVTIRLVPPVLPPALP